MNCSRSSGLLVNRYGREGFFQPNDPATVFLQGDPSVLAMLVKLMEDEESVRVKNKIADGVTQREWTVPEDLREPLRKVLPFAFSIDGDGRMKKRDVNVF